MLVDARIVLNYHDSKEQLIKYIGVDKDRYDRFDFETLMYNKYNARKLKSRDELKKKYINLCGSISDLESNIQAYSEGYIKSENYDIYLIDDKDVISKYFFRNGHKKCPFSEVYVEYDENNNIISSYFRGDYSHIHIEYNYFVDVKERVDPMIIDNWIKVRKK